MAESQAERSTREGRNLLEEELGTIRRLLEENRRLAEEGEILRRARDILRARREGRQ